jgi:hypothetical protein
MTDLREVAVELSSLNSQQDRVQARTQFKSLADDLTLVSMARAEATRFKLENFVDDSPVTHSCKPDPAKTYEAFDSALRAAFLASRVRQPRTTRQLH